MSIDKLDLQSPDFVNENFEKLAALFPNCVTESAEGKAIDFDLLKQELSHAVIDGNRERYRLEWPGKREAIVTANLPTTKTLRPVREDSVDYDNTENLYIEGDNLEVLKLLQESYFGKIKMIYIDPPYNTGNDFVYRDNFTGDKEEELYESGQIDEYNRRLVANPEASGRYHSDWLSMMYPRLKLARNLLTEDGVIFISIDDNELHNMRKLCDEIFGETNFISGITRLTKTGGAKGKFFTPNVEYLLVYSRNIENTKPFRSILDQAQIERYYNKIETTGERKGDIYGEERLYKASLDPRPNQRYWIECPDGSFVIPPGKNFPELVKLGEKILPTSEDGVWKWTFDRFQQELNKNNIVFKETNTSSLVDETNNPAKWNLYNKLWLDEQNDKGVVPPNFIDKFENRQSSKELKELDIPFDFAKPTSLLRHLLIIVGLDKNDIILDFFSGSATTAHAVMQLNAEDSGDHKYIMVQLPEQTDEKSEAYKAGYKNICEIGKERIRRSANKIKEEKRAKAEKEGMFADFEDTQDYGFRVYRLADSNMQDVYYRPQDYKQETLDMFDDNIKPDRTPDDLLVQVMLDWGLPLSYKIEQATINGKQVFKVAQDSLFACFDKGIDEAFAKEIAKEKPLRIVFRDNGFANDTAKTNVQQLLKQLSPETEMKVI